MSLPAVVLAHQQGIALSAYRREHSVKTLPCADRRFELRRTEIVSAHGSRRTAWVPWRIGIAQPFRVYDVYASSIPRVTEAALMVWLYDGGM